MNPVNSRRENARYFSIVINNKVMLEERDSLSGVQSVKRGTSSGTLSMFFR